MSYLILVRHGQSRWNKANRFTGWVDVALSEQGIKEAQQAAQHIKNIPLDLAFTSKLNRAQETLSIILTELNYTGIYIHSWGKMKRWSFHKTVLPEEIPIHISAKINERYYGKLQGENKQKIKQLVGPQQLHLWRRGFREKPPGGESLQNVYHRTIPYCKRKIFPYVTKGNNVLVSAHGNSLRAIIKYLENISDFDVQNLELPTGKPVIYEFSQGKFTRKKPKKVLNKKASQKKKNTSNYETTVRLTHKPNSIHVDEKSIHPLQLNVTTNKITIQGHPHWHDLTFLDHKAKLSIKREQIKELSFTWWYATIKLTYHEKGKDNTFFIKYMDRSLEPYSRKKTKELFDHLRSFIPLQK